MLPIIDRRKLLALLASAFGYATGSSVGSNAYADDASYVAQKLTLRRHVMIVVGPSEHPPGTHEVAAGARVMAHCLEQATTDMPKRDDKTLRLGKIKTTIVDQWPDDQSLLDSVSSLVFIGDIFPAQKMPNTKRMLEEIGAMIDRGCGIACIHYATGLRAEDVADDGEHPLLHWMGGYFATKCKHHQSVARIFKEATIEPALKDHVVSRGWKAFTIHDEPYINNYFGPDDNRPAPGVLTFATSMLPPEAPQRQIVAWGAERKDKGRGFAIVMPHFYRNWADDDLRTLILNGICWTAHQAIPDDGVRVELNDLQPFLTAKSP